MSKTEQKTKKPPAYEVILGRLKELSSRIKKWQRLARRDDFAQGPREIPMLQWFSGELLGILERMHLPEKERPKILAALRALRGEVIGTHTSRMFSSSSV